MLRLVAFLWKATLMASVTWSFLCLGFFWQSKNSPSDIVDSLESCVYDEVTRRIDESPLPKLRFPQCSAVEKFSKKHKETCITSSAALAIMGKP